MSRHNATITADVLGTYLLNCVWIGHGIHVLSREGEGSTRKVFYPSVTTTSGFGMDVVFRDLKSRDRFSDWMRSYFDRTVAGRGFRAPCHVDVPLRNFHRVCIPKEKAEYGEGVTDVGYVMRLSFTGSTDPLEIGPGSRGTRSFFQMPGKDVKHAKNYYPGGIQLAGADLLDTTLFDGWEVSGAHAANEDEFSGDDSREEVNNE